MLNLYPPKFLAMHGVYILYSRKKKEFYVGFSKSIKRRVSEHQKGQNKSTKNKQELKCIGYEVFANKQDAMERERYLKTGWGRAHLRKMFKYTLGNT